MQINQTKFYGLLITLKKIECYLLSTSISRYALDWLPEKGLVTVLYGDVMCTLSLQSNYPEAGSVSLVKITGGHEKHPEISSLLVSFRC